MSGRRLATLTRRIVDQFRRDPRTLALLFVAPVAIMALLGWVVGEQDGTGARVVFVAGPAGPDSAVLHTIEASLEAEGIVVLPDAPDEAAARSLLIDSQADVAVILPAGLGSGASPAAAPDIAIETLGLNPAAEGGSVAQLQRALAAVIRGLVPPQFASILPTFSHTTVYGSPDASSLDTLAPVFVGYFAYFFVFILTGVSFLRERIGGTLERLLATPITRAEIVLGYSVGFGLFASLQVAEVLAFTLARIEVPAIGPLPSFVIGLDVPNAGSPLLAYLIALVLGLGAVSLGIFISTFARTEFQVLQFIPIVIIPQGLLGGIFWPVDALPSLLQPIARVLPITYAVEGLRAVMIAGADLTSSTVQLDLLVLVAIAALFVVLAAGTIRREVA
jgi:ABC-2 type transport system permease protein